MRRWMITGLAIALAGLLPSTGQAGPFGNKGGTDASALISEGEEMLGYITLATDQGMQALAHVLDLFPEDRVTQIKEKAARYNEFKKSRNGSNIDSESMKIASEVAAEAALLEADWESYQAENADAVSRANRRLALVLLADGLAATKASDTLKSLTDGVKSLGNSPTNLRKGKKINDMISVLTICTTELPAQSKSFTTVRGITKSIAEAENIELADDPDPTTVRDLASFESTVQELDA